MTIQEILALADELYENRVSPSTKIVFLNSAMSDLSREYGRFKESVATLTVKDQEVYALPSDCIDLSHVSSLWVANTTTPTLDSDYVPYYLGSQLDNQKNSNTYYDAGTAAGYATQSFGLCPIPTEDDYPIKIRYRSKNDGYTIDDMNVEPDIDPRWHDALAYYIVYSCASMSPIPEESIANFWGNRYNEAICGYKMSQSRKETAAPKRRRDNKQWHTRTW